MPLSTASSLVNVNGSSVSNVDHVVREAERFEQLCKSMMDLNDMLDELENMPVKKQMRELLANLEGETIRFIVRDISIFCIQQL